MDDKQLIDALRGARPRAPQAPEDEWARVERATRPFSLGLSRFSRPAFALAAGMGMAALAFFIVPYFKPAPSPADQASLEPFLSELSDELEGSAPKASSHEDSYLALIDGVN